MFLIVKDKSAMNETLLTGFNYIVLLKIRNMPNTPFLTVNTKKIEQNAKKMATLVHEHGARLWGVTKVVLGDVAVAKSMLQGGCDGLADSRIESLKKLRQAFPKTPLLLIRPPSMSRLKELVQVDCVSLQSDLETIKILGEVSSSMGRTQKIVLMVELGDLREGVTEEELFPYVFEVLRTPGIELEGLGAVLTCFAGVVPDQNMVSKFIELASKISSEYKVEIKYLAPAATNFVPMLMAGKLPRAINDFRIGEGIILGMNVLDRTPLPGFDVDTVELSCEIIELKSKPSKPTGIVSQDAYGSHPVFEDRGTRRRAIINIGRGDCIPELLTPLDEGVVVLGGSSDHVVCDVEDATGLSVGDMLRFRPGYGALLSLVTSPFVEKVFV